MWEHFYLHGDGIAQIITKIFYYQAENTQFEDADYPMEECSLFKLIWENATNFLTLLKESLLGFMYVWVCSFSVGPQSSHKGILVCMLLIGIFGTVGV